MRPAEIKANAREHLLGNYSRIITVQLIFLCLSWSVSMLTGGFYGNGTGMIILSCAIITVADIILQVFNFGLKQSYLKLCCGMPYGPGDLFTGFKDNRVVICATLFGTLLSISNIPFYILSEAFAESNDKKMALLAFAAFAIFNTISYLIMLPLSQVYYLLMDLPEKSSADCLKMSAWLMKGRKFRLFRMQLSFLPLMLLAVFTLGIGMLWIEPYINASEASFYLNTAKEKE